jgi:hypothetical protein
MGSSAARIEDLESSVERQPWRRSGPPASWPLRGAPRGRRPPFPPEPRGGWCGGGGRRPLFIPEVPGRGGQSRRPPLLPEALQPWEESRTWAPCRQPWASPCRSPLLSCSMVSLFSVDLACCSAVRPLDSKHCPRLPAFLEMQRYSWPVALQNGFSSGAVGYRWGLYRPTSVSWFALLKRGLAAQA